MSAFAAPVSDIAPNRAKLSDLDNELLHQEAILPALKFLSDPRFAGADRSFAPRMITSRPVSTRTAALSAQRAGKHDEGHM